MAVNEKLTARVRELLEGVPKVVEKRMFRGISFLVDGKMCVNVGDDRIMCRIDPGLHAAAVKRPGCRTVEMGGRPYLGFVYVDEKSLPGRKDLKAWVDMALAFNPRAKASRRKQAKAGGKTAGNPQRKPAARKRTKEGKRP